MRILQVAPYMPPYTGGQERHVSTLVEHLRDAGHEVKILTSAYPDTAEPNENEYRLPVFGRILRYPIVRPDRTILDLLRWADVVHTHNEHSMLSVYVATCSYVVDTPVVLTCHGQVSLRAIVADVFESAYNRTVGLATLRAMDRVIALSESDEQYLIELGVDSSVTEIIPNAIEPPDTPSEAAVRQFRRQFDLRNTPVVLFVGPVVERKSPETVLRALPAVREEHPDATGVFVGDGEYLEELKAETRRLGLEDAVRFTGYLPEEQLHCAYGAASVLAFPSVSEGLPTTIMEGMSHGVPVVATDLAPIREWFADCALLVEPNPETFATALTRVLSDESVAARLATDGGARVEDTFTWDRISADILNTYQELVSSREQ